MIECYRTGADHRGLKQIAIASVFSFALAASGRAASATCVSNANQETVAEIGECAAYFLTVANGMSATPNQKRLMSDYIKSFEDMRSFALKIGADLNISTAATDARIRLHATAMSKLLAGNSGNWPIVLEKYAYKCKSLHDEPAARLKELINKECALHLN